MKKLKLFIDKEELLKIMRAFYTLTHIKATLYDSDYNEVIAYPEKSCDFCSLVRARHVDRCNISDKTAFEICQQQQRVLDYFCHAGLMEVISPLTKGNSVIGYIMFGQMMKRENREEEMKKIAKKYHYLVDNQELLMDSIKNIVVKGSDEIEAATLLMQTCIYYLQSNRIVALDEWNFVEQLDDYIAQHINESISIEDLCQYFNMSRTSFYLLSQKCLDKGIMSYIREKRINYAKELLQGTDLNVTEISERVGFSDYNYFFRIFKKETGISCKGFRKRYI